MKLLLYLKQFEGDGKMHEIESLFPKLSLTEKKNIFKELEEEKLITLSGREPRYYSHTIEKNILTNETQITESPFNKMIDESEPEMFKAKLTFKGAKYLKEEIEMKESGKYNINVSGEATNNTFVIESNKTTINNKPEFKNKIDKIIEVLKSDQSISSELRQTAISDFETAKESVGKTGKLPEKITKGILQHGSEISSIASLVLQVMSGLG